MTLGLRLCFRVVGDYTKILPSIRMERKTHLENLKNHRLTERDFRSHHRWNVFAWGIFLRRHNRARKEHETRSRDWIWLYEFPSFVIYFLFTSWPVNGNFLHVFEFRQISFHGKGERFHNWTLSVKDSE